MNLLDVRVSKRKFLAWIFLRALGIWLKSNVNSKSFGSDGQLEEAVKSASFTDEDLVRAFYVVDEVRVETGRLMARLRERGRPNLLGMKSACETRAPSPVPLVPRVKSFSRTAFKALARQNMA